MQCDALSAPHDRLFARLAGYLSRAVAATRRTHWRLGASSAPLPQILAAVSLRARVEMCLTTSLMVTVVYRNAMQTTLIKQHVNALAIVMRFEVSPGHSGALERGGRPRSTDRGAVGMRSIASARMHFGPCGRSFAGGICRRKIWPKQRLRT